MKEGRVEILLCLGVNPVYTAPADLDFEKHLQNVPLRVHLGLYQDETAVQCHWHIPKAHYLEAWGERLRLRRHGVSCSTVDRAALQRPFDQ